MRGDGPLVFNSMTHVINAAVDGLGFACTGTAGGRAHRARQVGGGAGQVVRPSPAITLLPEPSAAITRICGTAWLKLDR